MATTGNRAEAISDDQWEKMKSMISDQLDNVTSSLDELRESGSLETIAQVRALTRVIKLAKLVGQTQTYNHCIM